MSERFGHALVRTVCIVLLVIVIAFGFLFGTKPGGFVLRELKSSLMGKGLSRGTQRMQFRLKALNKEALQLPWLHVLKSKRVLLLKEQNQTIATFPIALGPNPIGSPKKVGDGRTPEGDYYICYKKEDSRYHLYLGISYPSPRDAKRGLEAGTISASDAALISRAWEKRGRPPWYTALGGAFGLHGYGVSKDWTEGTIAMTNGDIEEIFWNIPMGTRIQISP